MSLAVQRFQVNTREVYIKLEEIPSLSAATQKILTDMGTPPPSSLEPFKKGGLIQNMQAEIQRLTADLCTAQSHTVKDKCVALLKSALIVGLLSAAIFGFYNVFIHRVDKYLGLAFPCFLAASLIPLKYDTDYSQEIGKEPMHPGMGIIFFSLVGIFIPLIQVFGRKARLEKTIVKKRTELAAITRELSHPDPALQEILQQSFVYFAKEGEALQKRLEERAKSTEESAEKIKMLSTKSLAGEKELEDNLIKLKQAQDEVQAVSKFYSRFST